MQEWLPVGLFSDITNLLNHTYTQIRSTWRVNVMDADFSIFPERFMPVQACLWISLWRTRSEHGCLILRRNGPHVAQNKHVFLFSFPRPSFWCVLLKKNNFESKPTTNDEMLLYTAMTIPVTYSTSHLLRPCSLQTDPGWKYLTLDSR